MQFALFGDHPDGLDMARALVEAGRHQLLIYSGSAVGEQYLQRWGLPFQKVGDMEEALANPAVDAVIVAGRPGNRANQLRRALQSERHVLCVHPADQTPEIAYEAAIVQKDTRRVLLPLLPEAFHPGFERLAKMIATERGNRGERPPSPSASLPASEARGEEKSLAPPSGRGAGGEGGVRPPLVPRLLEMEWWSSEAILFDSATPGHKPGLPGWDVLRVLGGEIAEVSGYTALEELAPEDTLLLAGRFERGGLFQVNLLPYQPAGRWRITVRLRYAEAELLFPEGWPGPARLTWPDEQGQLQEQTWESWNPWPVMVEVFEAAVARQQQQLPKADRSTVEAQPTNGYLSWEDEVRSLELDDATRRSVERRRASTLEYRDDTEEASFKGSMTLMGCGLLWVSLLLLIFSRWLPWLGWLIAPLFGTFLVLQILRWIIPPKPTEATALAQTEESRADEKRPADISGQNVRQHIMKKP